jgi:hypothetical protein
MAFAMALFVLIHSPLVGPTTWEPVADVLRRRGHEVVMPVLRNRHAPYWEYHARVVRDSLEPFEPSLPLVFAGHSAAGHFLPMAARACGRPAAAYLFVDSGLPRDGMHLRDGRDPDSLKTIDGCLAPWGRGWPAETWETLIPDRQLRERFCAELEPVPLALFEEPLPVFAGWPDASCGYLLFSRFYGATAAEAADRGWPVRELPGEHLHMLAQPKAVADALLGLTAELGR